MWPGDVKSFFVDFGLAICFMVLARSDAETPVVVPFFASRGMQKFVWWGLVLFFVRSGLFIRFRIDFSQATQIMPLAFSSRKFIFSVVMCSARQKKSASSSRCSSKTIMNWPEIRAFNIFSMKIIVFAALITL